MVRPSSDMLVCWLTVYLVVVPGLPVVTVLLVVRTGHLLLSLLALPCPLYLHLWLAVYSYYKLTLLGRSGDKDFGWFNSTFFASIYFNLHRIK